jgi:glycerophosphoryl diester phosphodiesterase
MNTLLDARKKHGPLIATHRGMVCGNIAHNTLPAFECALLQGSHILETDVTRCGDGTLVIFHPKKESQQLGKEVHLEELSLSDVKKFRYLNDCRHETVDGILTLDEFLEAMKGRCLINLDHGWGIFPEMIECVRRHKMEDQILLKTPLKCDNDLVFARQIEELAPDMMFMALYKNAEKYTPLLESMNLNFVAAELVFETEDSPLLLPEYMEMHHRKNRLLWCNTILYDYNRPLSAGHTDDVSVTGHPEKGWGWVLDHGFDIIQTDWTLPLSQYLQNRKNNA